MNSIYIFANIVPCMDADDYFQFKIGATTKIYRINVSVYYECIYLAEKSLKLSTQKAQGFFNLPIRNKIGNLNFSRLPVSNKAPSRALEFKSRNINKY